MKISSKNRAEIQNLAREGKQISKIHEDNFPEYGYLDIHKIVRGSGGQSAQGAKKTISTRLKALATAHKKERNEIVEEIDELAGHLYGILKDSQKKLDSIRKVLENK